MQADLDSWDNFVTGNFLKASEVKSNEEAYVCVGVEKISRDESVGLRLHLQRDKKEWNFDLNKTNAKKLKDLGILTPKNIIGKKVFFKIALARNPKTNTEVDSLRIWKID